MYVKIICTNIQAAESLRKFFDVKSINVIKTDFWSVTEKTSDAEIKNFISDAFWLFVVADVESVKLAKKIETLANCLVTNIFSCLAADELKIIELEKNFGTLIILPEDKISETNFEKNKLVSEIITMSVNLIQDICSEQTALCGLDFFEIQDLMKNSGRAYIGIGEGFGENAPSKAIKNALKFPLMMDIKNAKGILVDFVGGIEDINMIEIHEAINFVEENAHEDSEILWQVNAVEEINNDLIKALVIATKF